MAHGGASRFGKIKKNRPSVFSRFLPSAGRSLRRPRTRDGRRASPRSCGISEKLPSRPQLLPPVCGRGKQKRPKNGEKKKTKIKRKTVGALVFLREKRRFQKKTKRTNVSETRAGGATVFGGNAWLTGFRARSGPLAANGVGKKKKNLKTGKIRRDDEAETSSGAPRCGQTGRASGLRVRYTAAAVADENKTKK